MAEERMTTRFQVQDHRLGGPFGTQEWRWRPVAWNPDHDTQAAAMAHLEVLKSRDGSSKFVRGYRILQINEAIVRDEEIVYAEARELDADEMRDE